MNENPRAEEFRVLTEALDEGAYDVAAIAAERIRERARANAELDEAVREFRSRLLTAALIAAMFDEIERGNE